MERYDAVELIEKGIYKTEKAQLWADLGCGDGAFTIALAELLQEGCSILAVDKNLSALRKIPSEVFGVKIEKRSEDMERVELPTGLDGVIMANSLHYVRGQGPFLNRVKKYLKPGAGIIIIEYDTDNSNPWLPYATSFQSLQRLVGDRSLGQIIKLHERKSMIRGGMMYSALIKILYSQIQNPDS